MRTLLYIGLFIFGSNVVRAQDTLYRNDGSKQIAKILELNETQVKYKLGSNMKGPTYVISKEALIKIVYETGLIDVFPKIIANNVTPRREDPRKSDFGRNFISLNVADLFFSLLTFSYERTFRSGDFSFKVPLSIGLTNSVAGYDQRGYYNRNKSFSTGFDFYFCPFGQGKAKYFFGPSLEYGQYRNLYYNYYYSSYNQNERVTYSAILLQNGFLFQPSKHFNLSVNAGIGYSHSGIHDNNIAIRAGLNVGFKF